MALAANTQMVTRGKQTVACEVVNAAQLYAGAYLAAGSVGHGTAANRGRVYPYNDEVGAIPLGFNFGADVLGNTAATPIPEASIDIDGSIKYVAVTGAGGTYADQWKKVYATDDGTFTLTKPTYGQPIGVVVKFIASGYAWVYFFPFGVMCAMGSAVEIINLGSVDCDTITAANVRTGFLMPFHGLILNFFAMVDVAVTGASGTALLNLEIGGTNVTGGVVTVSTAAGGTKGTLLAGTAITALNEFHEGDALDIEAATVTDMTAGRVDLFIKVSREFGI